MRFRVRATSVYYFNDLVVEKHPAIREYHYECEKICFGKLDDMAHYNEYISVNSLEDLLKLEEKLGVPLIIFYKHKDYREDQIEIYDDCRE